MSAPGIEPCGSDPIPEFDPHSDARHDRRIAELGPDRFIEQFRNRPILAAILRSLLAWCQRIEDAAWEVANYRTIERAEGVTLDMIGAIVRRGRAGLADKDYRIAIRAQIKILRSSGRPEDMIAIMRLSTPRGTALQYREEYPAGLRFEIATRVKFAIAVAWVALRLSKPAGVRVGLVYSKNVSPGRWFKFAPATTPVTDMNQGMGNALDSTTGGRFRTIRVSSP